MYFPVANIVAEMADGAFDVEITTGSIENLVRLGMGEVDFAIALSDRVGQAIQGLPPFDHIGAAENLRTVIALFPEPLTILVRADDDIDALSDLQGRVVNLGPTGNQTGRLLRLAMDLSGWVHRLEDFRDVPLADQADALCAGEVDAIAYLAAHPSGTVHQAASTCDVRALAIVGEVADALLAADATLAPARIPGGLYPGIDRPVDSVGPMALLVTRADIEDALVDALVGGVLDNLDTMARRHPALAGVDGFLPMVGRGPLPVHDRAADLLAVAPTQ